MGIEFRFASIHAGEGGTLNFSGEITHYVVGLLRFHAQYENHDAHCIKRLAVDLQVMGVNGNSISIRPDIVLEDNTGHRLDKKNTFVDVGVAAWIGNGYENTYVASNQQFPYRMSIPGMPKRSAVILSGFDMQFDDGDLTVRQVKVGTSLNMTSSELVADGFAEFSDNDNKHSTRGTVKGSLVADFDKYSGLFLKNIASQKNTDGTVRFDDLVYATGFISSFQLTTNSGKDRCHSLGALSKNMELGGKGELYTYLFSVDVYYLNQNDNHCENNENTNMGYTVFGIEAN